MHVRSTLISMAAVVAIATAVPANGDGKPFPPGSGGRCQDGCAIPRGAQAVGTQPFPPGSGGDYHDGPLLNVHGPTVPIQHGRGPIPRGAQGPDPQRFSPVSGEGHWDGRGPYTVARNFEGSKPYFSVHGPTVIPIHTKNGVIPGKMTPRDLEGKELDATEFDGPCKASSDCNVGSLCIANWCTVARELDDGTLVLPPRNIVGEDGEYWYYKSRTAMDVLDELAGKIDAKHIGNACPKKCDGKDGKKRCCPRHFCQPPRCLGDPDDFKDHD